MTLREFGGGAPERKPPRLERKVVKQSPHTGKIAGFVCADHAEHERVYASRRFPPTHYFRKHDGYGMSESLIRAAEAIGSSRVIVFEDYGSRNPTETRDVYEFTLRQYREGERVSPDEHPADDPQRVVPVDEARHVWENHGHDLFVRGFREAMRRIDWRGWDADHPARDNDE